MQTIKLIERNYERELESREQCWKNGVYTGPIHHYWSVFKTLVANSDEHEIYGNCIGEIKVVRTWKRRILVGA